MIKLTLLCRFQQLMTGRLRVWWDMRIVIGPAMTQRLGDLYRAFTSVSVAAIRSTLIMLDLTREEVKYPDQQSRMEGFLGR